MSDKPQFVIMQTMKSSYLLLPLACLFFLALPLCAQNEMGGGKIGSLAEAYAKCESTGGRLRLANDFFNYLLEIDYIEEPIRFPAGSHIDSVDVNVYFYVAEWYYGEGDYMSAISYCLRATHCMGVVDDRSKSDVYSLLGAAYFRISAYEKAAEALNRSYRLDKEAGDFDRMSSTLNSIGSVLVAAGKPREAEKYILEAIAANSLTDNLSRRAVLLGTASELYRSLDDAEQALDFAQKALLTERKLGDSARIGVRLSQLASAQLSLSKVDDARRSLDEAIPLLHRSGNRHSWGICQNQLGDILASEGKNQEAAARYRVAAKLFLSQGDKYNELHAREGLYQAMKDTDPSEAMVHMERAMLLRDSIYQTETAEAISRYNAIYHNDILQKENEQIVRRNHTFLAATAVSFALLLALIILAVFFTYRRHRRKVKNYEQDITSLQDQVSEVSQKYQNVVADTMRNLEQLTDDDREFLQDLSDHIIASAGRGVTDIEAIAAEMHISTSTLRRRLSQTLSVTPKAYIQQVRMQQARYLLQNYSDLTVAQIADRCGYTQLPNFTRAFKNFYGIMPSAVRTQKD